MEKYSQQIFIFPLYVSFQAEIDEDVCQTWSCPGGETEDIKPRNEEQESMPFYLRLLKPLIAPFRGVARIKACLGRALSRILSIIC